MTIESHHIALLENALDAVVGINSDNIVTYWNSNAEKIFGWSRADILGQDMGIIVPERLRDRHRAGMRRFIETGVAKIQNQRIEIPGLRRNGEEFLMELTVSSYPSETGYQFFAFMRDITAQKRAQDTIAMSERTLAQFFEQSDAMLVVLRGKELVIERANAKYTDFIGKEALVGKPFRDVWNANDKDDLPNRLEEVFRTREPYVGTEVLMQGCYFDFIYQPLLDSDGQVYGLVGQGFDVTDKVIARRELEVANVKSRAEAEWISLITNAIPNVVAYIGRDQRYQFVNSAYESWFGKKFSDVVGNTVADVVGPDYERLKPRIEEVLKGNEVHYQVTVGLGGTRQLDSRYIPDFDSDGQVRGFVAVAHDVTQIKEAEDRLRQSEVELRNLANSIPQLAWMAHPDGNIFWYNERWFEYTGTTLAEMDGWGWQKVHREDTLPGVLEAYKDSIRKGEPADYEFPLRSKTGEYRWFLTRWLPFKDQDGKVLRWFGTNTDIHEQRLARNDQAFRANLTTTLNSIEDIDAILAQATRALANYLGASRCFIPEIHGSRATIRTDYAQGLPSLSGEYDLMTFGPQMVASWHSGEIVQIEDVTTDSRTRQQAASHIELGIRSFITIPMMRWGKLVAAMNVTSTKPRVWTSREVDLVQVIAETIWLSMDRASLLTELKASNRRSDFLARASQALTASLEVEQILKQLSDLTVPELADWCSIRMLDSKGQLKQVTVSHQDPEKVKLAWDLQSRFPADPEAPSGPYQVIRTGKPELINNITHDMIIQQTKHPEQQELLIELGLKSYICVPIYSRDRVAGTLSLVTSEVSGRQLSNVDLELAKELGIRTGIAVENARLYLEAQSVSRLKDEFLANLSHELRTPMNVIQGHAELLKMEGTQMSAQALENSVSAIERNARAQTAIIADLLDVSSIITGKVIYKPTEIRPGEVIQQIVDNFQPTALAKGVRLISDLEDAPKVAAADETRLHQIVWNLISNAIKFTEKNGRIDVRVFESPTGWSLQVSDDGQGIDVDFIPYVFDRFRQEDASSTRRFGGLGLGLSVVRHLVELHGGSVKAESAGRNQGATFTVTFPQPVPIKKAMGRDSSSQPVEKALSHSVSLSQLNGVNILLVEDSEDSRELIQLMLSRAGARVVAVDSAGEARKMLKSYFPDIIVSDIGMPEENGLEFIAKLRSEATSRIPAIALTAYVRAEEKEAALNAGFDAHIGKPISAPALIDAIRNLVTAHSEVER